MDDKIVKITEELFELKDQLKKYKNKKSKIDLVKTILHIIYALMLIMMFLFSEVDHEKIGELITDSNQALEKIVLLAQNSDL